jgi:hypothetical protein
MKKSVLFLFILTVVIILGILIVGITFNNLSRSDVLFSVNPEVKLDLLVCNDDLDCPPGWRCENGRCFPTQIDGTKTECTGECYACLLNAIRQVESGGEPNEGCDAIGDDGASCGPYQIQQGYCDDAKLSCSLPGGQPCCELNTIDYQSLCQPCNGNAECCAEKKRVSELKMACYFRRYTQNGPCSDGHGQNNKFTCEDLARMHNGGPCGHLSPATEQYWNLVREIMEQTCPQCLDNEDDEREAIISDHSSERPSL